MHRVLIAAAVPAACLVLAAAAFADVIRGDSRPDILRGTAGADRMYGLGGADRLTARDGRRDLVHCGTGNDRAVTDAVDLVSSC